MGAAHVTAAPLATQLPVNGQGKAAEDGPGASVPATSREDLEAPGFELAQPWLVWPLGVNQWMDSFSCLTFSP